MIDRQMYENFISKKWEKFHKILGNFIWKKYSSEKIHKTLSEQSSSSPVQAVVEYFLSKLLASFLFLKRKKKSMKRKNTLILKWMMVYELN